MVFRKTEKRSRKGFWYRLRCMYWGGEARMLMLQAVDQIEYEFDYLSFEEQRQAAFDHYCEAMAAAGFDLGSADVLELIEQRIWMEWGSQTGYFQQLEAERQAQIEYERALQEYYRQQKANQLGGQLHTCGLMPSKRSNAPAYGASTATADTSCPNKRSAISACKDRSRSHTNLRGKRGGQDAVIEIVLRQSQVAPLQSQLRS